MVSRSASVLSILVVLMLTGCASTNQIAEQVVKSNKAQEQAQNQLVLLNILRAYKRRPMHFTQISQIRVPVGFGNPTLTIPTPFGPDRTQAYNVSTAFSVQQGVDTTVLNSQEFIRGITTPLPPSTMLYYLEQGWPQQLILYMFVRKIEVYQGDKLKTEYLNYPESEARFNGFKDFVSRLKECDFQADAVEGKPYGPPLTREELAADISGLASASAGFLSVRSIGNHFQFVKESKAISLKATEWTEDSQTALCNIPGGSALLGGAGESSEFKKRDGGQSVRFVLRSPEAMLYYLGEVARAGIHDSRPTKFVYSQLRADTLQTTEANLFRVELGKSSTSAVSVEYDGETFSIPDGTPEDRSTHVLSLITQILGLQNKGDSLPSTANVRLVQ